MSNRISSLTIADGVFTPAVSVTSAVGGIGVAKPSVIKDTTAISIVGYSTKLLGRTLTKLRQVFLLVFFLVQQFGTARLGFTFAPGTFHDHSNACII